jgi:hypothetical protein
MAAMATPELNRAQFLRRAAAIGLLTSAGGFLATGNDRAAAARPSHGLAWRGVCYDTGTTYDPATPGLTREVWDPVQIAGEIGAVRHGLHCNAITVLGSDVERLATSAALALRLGLRTLIQPRLFDFPQGEVLDHLARTARTAERLRRRHRRPGVVLVVGCEAVLFTPGIVPGNGFYERVEYLTEHPEELPAILARLDAFLDKAVTVARRNFHGPITYGAAAGLEDVDWSRFDLVGLDYYDYHPTTAEHRLALATYRRWNKPIMILEFGCCTFTGAAEAGGMGWDVIDYTKDPPEIPDGVVRDEAEQARHLVRMLGVFDDLGLYGASIYNFISPDMPHSPVRRYDLDIASYSLVETIREEFADPASPYHWRPKQSFHAVARYNLNR